VGLCCFGEGIVVLEAEFEVPSATQRRTVAGALLEVGTGGDVVLHGGRVRKSEPEVESLMRSKGGTARWIHRRERASRAAGGRQAAIEGGLADGIVDDGDAFAGGEFADFRGEVFLGVEDGFVGAGCAGERGFLSGETVVRRVRRGAWPSG